MLSLYSLEQHIEAQMKAACIPGLALAIVKDQEVVYAKGFVVTSVEDGGLPVTPQTLFRIGSTTKPLTGTAVMRLVEDGKLNLDRPVREYVDWLTFSEEGAIDRVTLRMLMSHTAGLPTAAEHFGSRDPGGLAARIREEIPTCPLIAPPGKLFSYSNPGVNLVGYIAEVVSGKPYTELMQELVFDPLEMKHTTFDPTVAMTYPLAQSHDLNALRKDLYFGQKPDSEETVSVGFVPEEASPTQYIIVDGTPYGRIKRDSSFVPDPLAWKAYVGTYTGVFPLETFIKDGCLYVDFTFFHQKLSCTPLDNTRFVCERGLIEFQMADDGAVSTLIWGKSFTFTRVHEM